MDKRQIQQKNGHNKENKKMNKNTILNYLKDHYKKEDKAQMLMENKIDNDILSEAKSKKKLRINSDSEK